VCVCLSVCVTVCMCVYVCLCVSLFVCVCMLCVRFVVMNFLSSKAAKQAADTMKTLREDLTIQTDDGAAFPSELTHSLTQCFNRAMYILPHQHSAWSESRGELYPRERKKILGSVFAGMVISWKHLQLNNIIGAIFHT